MGDGGAVWVRPGTADAAEFAQRHRLRPLQTAFGELESEPGWYGIGIGGQLRGRVDATLFQMWWHCGDTASLWQACQRVADQDHGAPDAVLEHFCRNGHTLLCCGAAYLDAATPRR